MDPSRYDNNLERTFSICANLMDRYPSSLVSAEHLLLAIVEQNAPTTRHIFEVLNINTRELARRLTANIYGAQEAFPVRREQFNLADETIEIFQRAESFEDLTGDEKVGVEHILLAITMAKTTSAQDILSQAGCDSESVRQIISSEITKRKPSQGEPGALLEGSNGSKARTERKLSQALIEMGEDLSEKAEAGKLDPVIGREDELSRVLNILSRRTKNNPVLIGEAGVGKTAIAEGLALKIARAEVPVSLRGYRVFSLDVGKLVAGTSLRGQFEERLKTLIEELIALSGSIILFIDELHLLVGAGATTNSGMDAGNMLKPYLARGQIRCIGATTFSEYTKYIEKDPALARRFQSVVVKEPTVDQTVSILRGLKDKFEVYHGIAIKDTALTAAAKLSHRYITDRRLPDKAIDLVDEAASRKRLEIDSPPEDLLKITAEIHRLELERTSLVKDADEKANNRLNALEIEIEQLNQKAASLRRGWSRQIDSLSNVTSLKEKLEILKAEIDDAKRKLDFRKAAEIEHDKLKPLEKLLSQSGSQSDPPMQAPLGQITDEEIASLVSQATGIPVNRISTDESLSLIEMEESLSRRILGQKSAVKAVANSVRIARTGLNPKNRPIGTFLFLGPTGVGKTEMAKALAELLFNDNQALIRLDMSEYFDRYTVSRLIGASPGYIGFDDGGQLTEAVRKRPYSCLLFDEIEKAHSDVYNIFLQILDEGRLTDSKGRKIDFTNTLILMTSNIGAGEILGSKDNHEADPRTAGGIDALDSELKKALLARFKPELLNRIDDIVVFEPLTKDQLAHIVRQQLDQLSVRLSDSRRNLEATEAAVAWLSEKGYDPTYGARPIRRAIRNFVEAPLSEHLLKNDLENLTILIDVENDRLCFASTPDTTP